MHYGKTEVPQIYEEENRMNCFGFGENNCYLWILILILLFCCKGCGGIEGVCGLFDKCGCILPVLLAFLLCCCKDKGGHYGGCGCK